GVCRERTARWPIRQGPQRTRSHQITSSSGNSLVCQQDQLLLAEFTGERGKTSCAIARAPIIRTAETVLPVTPDDWKELRGLSDLAVHLQCLTMDFFSFCGAPAFRSHERFAEPGQEA